jgi:hypothetical protein
MLGEKHSRRHVARAAIPLVLATVLGSGARPRRRARRLHIIPAVTSFRGTVGSADRPFTRPGGLVTLTLDGDCPAAVSDQVVIIVFKPPGDAARNVVAETSPSGEENRTAASAIINDVRARRRSSRRVDHP